MINSIFPPSVEQHLFLIKVTVGPIVESLNSLGETQEYKLYWSPVYPSRHTIYTHHQVRVVFSPIYITIHKSFNCDRKIE